MIDRYFELNDSTHNHHKFWEVVLDGTVVNVYFGRIGTKGQCQVKTFPAAGMACAHVSRLIHEKEIKGYVEKPSGKTKTAQAPLAKPATAQPPSPPPPEAPVLPKPGLLPRSRMRVGRIRRRKDEDES